MPSDMACLRQRSAHFAPASCSCKIPMIYSSVRIVRFIVRPPHGADTSRRWRKNPGAGQARRKRASASQKCWHAAGQDKEATMARTAKTKDQSATKPFEAPDAAATPKTAARALRPGRKLANVIDPLEGEDGANIAEMITATRRQQHTVRGALARSITKKFGRTLSPEEIEDHGRVYRITVRQA